MDKVHPCRGIPGTARDALPSLGYSRRCRVPGIDPSRPAPPDPSPYQPKPSQAKPAQRRPATPTCLPACLSTVVPPCRQSAPARMACPQAHKPPAPSLSAHTPARSNPRPPCPHPATPATTHAQCRPVRLALQYSRANLRHLLLAQFSAVVVVVTVVTRAISLLGIQYDIYSTPRSKHTPLSSTWSISLVASRSASHLGTACWKSGSCASYAGILVLRHSYIAILIWWLVGLANVTDWP